MLLTVSCKFRLYLSTTEGNAEPIRACFTIVLKNRRLLQVVVEPSSFFKDAWLRIAHCYIRHVFTVLQLIRLHPLLCHQEELVVDRL